MDATEYRKAEQFSEVLAKISIVANDTGYLRCLSDLVDIALRSDTTTEAKETLLLAATILRRNVKP